MPRKLAGRRKSKPRAGSRISELSRRERQIMAIIYRLGRASTAEVRRQLPDPPSYSTVRALLTILERKGQLKHLVHGPRYVYLPARSRQAMGRAALRQLLDTFFEGSLASAMACHLAESNVKLIDEDRKRLAALIRAVRKKHGADSSRHPGGGNSGMSGLPTG